MEKIKSNWIKGELSYRFGACVSIGDKNNYSIWIKDRINNTEVSYENNSKNKPAYISPQE